MTHAEQQAAIDAAAYEFPPTFGLRDARVHGRRFRINRGNSYWSDMSGVLLYVDIQIPESAGQEARWASYCKGTPEEFKREATEDPEVTKAARKYTTTTTETP